jgi:hypothetical protein
MPRFSCPQCGKVYLVPLAFCESFLDGTPVQDSAESGPVYLLTCPECEALIPKGSPPQAITPSVAPAEEREGIHQAAITRRIRSHGDARHDSPRRFRVADAIILIAATSVGLALTCQHGLINVIHEKLVQKYYPDGLLHPPEDGNLSDLGVRFLAPWSLALAGLRLVPPGPARRRLLAQPGFAATATASVLMALRLGQFSIENAVQFHGQLNNYTRIQTMTDPSPVAPAVLTAWTLMAMFGRYRPEKSWIDRAGRAIGALWIGMAIMVWCRWPTY